MDPSIPADAKNDLALEAVTGMLGAFRVGTVRLDGMSVDAPKAGDVGLARRPHAERLVERRARQPSS